MAISLAAKMAYGMALADHALRIASAERRAAQHEQREVARGAEAVAAWARGLEASMRAGARSDDEAWVGALNELAIGLDSPDDAAAIRSLAAFQRRLGNEPAFDTVAGFMRACAGNGPLVLGGRPTEPARRRGPTEEALRALGCACAAPVEGSAGVVLRTLVADRHDRWTRTHAGLHLAVDRQGKLHDHHGVYLGDGSLVHFSGEPGKGQRAGRVERVALNGFLGEEGLEHTKALRPERLDGEPVATLDPAVACLRVLSKLRDDRYQLVRNNCEHLSTWAQLGASLSFQIEKFQTIVLPQTQAHRAVSDVLGRRLRLVGDAVPGDILLEGSDDAYPVDLARAYYDRDRQQVVTWFPLWSDGGEPVGARHRPWTIGPLSTDSDWHTTAPSLDLDPDWHASLVAFHGAGAYWLTSDGACYKEEADLLEIIETRLEPTRTVLKALMSRPSKLAQAAVNFGDGMKYGRRDTDDYDPAR